jgi:hypothetical protein
MFLRLVATLALGVGLVCAALADEGSRSSSTAAISTIKCVRDILKSKPAVRSVSAYTIDDFRAAVEFTFLGKRSNEITSDIILTVLGNTTNYMVVHAKSEETAGEGTDFLSMADHRELSARCQISPAFDDLLPGIKSRDQWTPLNLPN